MSTFILMMLCFSCLVAGTVTFRVTLTTDWTLWQKILLFLVLSFVFMTPPLLRCPIQKFYGTACLILTYALYFCFVCLFLFFCLMFLRDIGWFILRFAGCPLPSPMSPPIANMANLILLAIVVVLSAISLIEGMRIPRITEITLTSDKIHTPLKVAVLPDIHIHRALLPSKLRGIVHKTNALNPDVILLPGDILDDYPDTISHLLPILNGFKARYGTFATFGNHEVYLTPSSSLYTQNNMTLLQNDYRPIRSDIVIAGVPDSQATRINTSPNFDQAFPRTDAFTILMAHSPKMFDMTGNTADLQVSGHTHGGQIFPFHFLAWLSNHYLSGLHHQGHRTLYVSKGSGQWGPQMRLLAPAEITLITLLPRK